MHASSLQSIDNLRVDALVNPLGIDDLQPRLSWQLSSTAQNQSQQAYKVQAATNSALLTTNRPDLWDSGKVLSLREYATLLGLLAVEGQWQFA